MDLIITQLLLARFYTDATLRNRFISDPETVAREFGLDSHQTSEFAQLSARQVSFFADSLIRKRLGEVCKLLPLTRTALGIRFDSLFRRFAQCHRLHMPKPHQSDAIAFCAFLEKAARADFPEKPWALDMARFETACLEANVPGQRGIVRLFRYPVRELARSVVEADQMPVPASRHTLAVWLRFSRQGRLRSFTLSLPRLWPTRCQTRTQLLPNAPRAVQEREIDNV